MKRILFALLISISTPLFSQTSPYQTSDGSSSLFLNKVKFAFAANITTSSFGAAYLHENSGKSFEYGLEFDDKLPTNNTTQGQTPGMLTGIISIGYHSPFANLATETAQSHLRDDWTVARLAYLQSSFTTVTTSTSTPVKHTFVGWKAMPVYNSLLNFKYFGLLQGEAVGIARTNNIGTLKQITIGSSTNYLGVYREYTAAPIYTDSVFFPKNFSWINFDAFTRSNATMMNRYIEGGGGIYFADPKNPTKITCGYSMGWNNGGSPIYTFIVGFSF
jgi:hypothetical protein